MWCPTFDSAPSLWSNIKEWFRNKIQGRRTCPKEYDFVCACSTNGKCMSAASPCIIEAYNEQYGTGKYIVRMDVQMFASYIMHNI